MALTLRSSVWSITVAALVLVAFAHSTQADPLPSWQDSDSKTRIVDFVESVTDPESDSYITARDRVAVFDNDGTLWAEKPIYFQLLFAIDRLQKMAKEDPSIASSGALKAAVEGDLEALSASGHEGLLEIITVTHSNISAEDFTEEARQWLEKKHPETGLRYRDMVYQPMLELLRYLRDEGFQTYIVSGGGLHFIRAFAEEVYNIPPNQVIGTTLKASYQMVDGEPAIMKEGQLAFLDDKEGKPVAIDTRIGIRPVIAVGNSDGDFQMLEWSTSAPGASLGILIHHTDGEREWAYDRDSAVGSLERGLDEASSRDWLLVNMEQDWEQIWPVQP
ncbi:HAD family hydrolase [Marinobacter sp. F4206]|uniref:HAD family hydrolase n=1 Tax=Marinobacter sp. F4206 TaxID=2861777 RepID=UPI001C5D8872|nr:HAD family hydrolase [Marinobacter sp. F4206]MBW4935548.1 haloacid dehalogenase-like hydrolase [Marinobacter sp. F4206]